VREAILAVVASWLLAVQPLPATAPTPVERAFPVRGAADYAAAHHDYPATDVFARCGRQVVSPVDGVVLELSRRDRWDPSSNRGARRGGRFVSIRGDDGVRYYLSHLRRVRPAVRAGDRVRAGGHIAWVGSSGSARGVACHVHFGLSPVCAGTGQWRIRRGVVAPYAFLRSWESGGNRSPRAAVGAWRQRHGCR
jgi:peptidoglycan LD-endopeptidase LytH